MFELKITFDTAEELSSFMAARALTSAPAEAESAPKPKRQPKAVASTPEEISPEPAQEAADSPAEPEKEITPVGEPAVAYADVQKAVTGLAAAKGRGAVLGVLEQFGVDHASKIGEAQWGELIAALTDASA